MFRPVQNPLDDEEVEGRVRTRTRTKELVTTQKQIVASAFWHFFILVYFFFIFYFFLLFVVYDFIFLRVFFFETSPSFMFVLR